MKIQVLIPLFALVACVEIVSQTIPTLAKSSIINANSINVNSPVHNAIAARACTRENDVVNIRSGPGKNYRVVRQAQSGSYIAVVTSTQGRDGFTWNQVSYNGSIGWVRGDYLCESNGE
jgi:uncharacterized protein YraI